MLLKLNFLLYHLLLYGKFLRINGITFMTDNNRVANCNDFNEQLNESFAYCHELTRTYAKNFYYGICLTAKTKRLALYAVYAWMKTLDDIVDSNESLAYKDEKLKKFYADTVLMVNPNISPEQFLTDEKFWLAFRHSILQYKIPFAYLQAMFDGQKQDLQPIFFQNFAELYQYCYRVASTVGLICIKIWGYEEGKIAEQLAEYQGIAFQLTNILRDVTADLKLGRDYLPGAPHTKDQLGIMISDLIDKTADYYEKAKDLVKYVHKDGRASLRAMTSIYYHIFLKLKAHPEQIPYQTPIKLNFLQKLLLVLKAEFIHA